MKEIKNSRNKANKAKESKKAGRKPWEPDYERIEQWALHGLSDKAIAVLCGISPPVFCTKKNELPKLRTALEYGRAKGEAAVSQKLLTLALNGDRDLIKYYLSRRCGWSETTYLDIPSKPIHEMTDAELLAIING